MQHPLDGVNSRDCNSLDGVKDGTYLGGMTADQNAREKIERILRDNPRLTAVEIAARAGVTRQRVHQLLEDMRYELDCVWRKAKGAKA